MRWVARYSSTTLRAMVPFIRSFFGEMLYLLPFASSSYSHTLTSFQSCKCIHIHMFYNADSFSPFKWNYLYTVIWLNFYSWHETELNHSSYCTAFMMKEWKKRAKESKKETIIMMMSFNDLKGVFFIEMKTGQKRVQDTKISPRETHTQRMSEWKKRTQTTKVCTLF